MKMICSILAFLMLAACASAPEGSRAWLVGAPAETVTIDQMTFRVLQREDPNYYYAMKENLLYVNADLQYVQNAVKAVEEVSGCNVVAHEQQSSAFIEALVECE